MIEVLEPEDELLRRFVDSIYVFGKGPGPLEFTAYPSTNTPVGLFRDVQLSVAPGRVSIAASDVPNYLAIACNPFASAIHLHYRELCDEIAINFKPLGFSSFSRCKPRSGQLTDIDAWNTLLPGLFETVFATKDSRERLHCIETFLLAQYIPVPEEAKLLKALELLNDISANHRMADIAAAAGLHYKQLYRLFSDNIGCSMAHYRNLVKFRASVFSKLDPAEKRRLVDVCYANGYTDQAYFIRQFRQLTGEKPGKFFRDAVAFGKNKIIFKMD